MRLQRTARIEALALAERILEVLAQGAVTTTYKYALLVALVDLSLEAGDPVAGQSGQFELLRVAERVLELYWPQAELFAGFESGARVPRQLWTRGEQAEVVKVVGRLRQDAERRGAAPTIAQARRNVAKTYDRVLAEIAWKLAEQPLPRLQRIGASTEPFLYEIGWDESITRSKLFAPGFDNRVHLLPGVAEGLVRLSGLLRPAVLQKWAQRVSTMNHLETASLEQFLFGREREAVAPAGPGLRHLQDGLCFYCREPIRDRVHVDHFLPWARYPDNTLANLVAAHDRCSQAKSAFLAAAVHVERWRDRIEEKREELAQLSDRLVWDNNPASTLGVARGIYLRLPETASLWVEGNVFRPMAQESQQLRTALAT